MPERWGAFLFTAALVGWLALPLPADAAGSRGVTIELRESDAPNAPVAGKVDLYDTSYALVIGIDRYTGGWPRLSNAVRDAELVAAELERKGFEVTLQKNLASGELKRVLEEFFVIKGESPQARLFVWYAGHGYSENGEGFLVPADAPRPEVGAPFRLKALALRRFGEFVRLARSKHAYMVFDSCFAGTVFDSQRALPPAAITRATTLPVRQFLTSGDADQAVSDDGTFRKLFIRALRGEERADANGDGYLTATEVGLYLSDRVTNLTHARQTPRYGKLRDEDFDRGDFVFALPARAAKAPAPKQTGGASVDPQALELAFWQSVKDSADPADFQDYLAQFPGGTFARLARRRLEDLKRQKAAALVPPGQTPSAAPPAVRPVVGAFPEGRWQARAFKDCDVCPELVAIPAGRFRMGTNTGNRSEGPVHGVAVPRRMAMGKHEVTFAEWNACVRDGGCTHRPRDAGWGKGRRPVINVSWADAQEYVYWLSRKTGKRYRLPSEAIWEYAARAGTTTERYWGDDADVACRYANVHDRTSMSVNNVAGPIHQCSDDFVKTAPVGSFRPNRFGLHDMLGNVWEWMSDCWHADYTGAPSRVASWTKGGGLPAAGPAWRLLGQ